MKSAQRDLVLRAPLLIRHSTAPADFDQFHPFFLGTMSACHKKSPPKINSLKLFCKKKDLKAENEFGNRDIAKDTINNFNCLYYTGINNF